MPEQSNEDSIVDGEMKNVKKIDAEHNPYSNVDQWGRTMKLSCVYCIALETSSQMFKRCQIHYLPSKSGAFQNCVCKILGF